MAGLLKNPTDAEIIKYIDRREDFHIEGNSQKENTLKVERLLESRGFSVRIKTKGREVSLLVPPLWIVNATLQLGHTIATWDPDWVIYKNVFGSKIEVKYYKKES
jgi:hypothetical protein